MYNIFMDKDNQLRNDQNNFSSQSNVPATPNPQLVQAEQNQTSENASPTFTPQIIASGPAADISSSTVDKTEKALNVRRILFVIGCFILIIGGIIGVMYFTKAGIFGEKRISAGNHSFLINEHDWLINEVDESDYSITLDSNDENNITLSITDNPALSNYRYDDQSAGQAIGLIGKTTATKKTSEDVNCMVYDTSTSHQGVSFYLKSAFCDISNNYNAIVAVASQNSNVLEKYLNEGIEILKTGQK